ncbi:ABC transporter ATP-binding protein [Microbacterium esteraromaticum]|uniref:ABC transporter ATP-binding protein n=1 Tax=Microbacterium esteraromaticum TaxID=57043 RepID=A0A7D8ALL4_9MICO|nr:ABC transporter ATP-binding protein [Microbacterium esteraromaticum]QMU97527.1 ABC transporter ATP-binding protein [Microbacterium esteraromaticum]
MTALLRVEDLTVEVRSAHGTSTPVNGISFDIERGETVGIVGESGSGKSLTAMSIIQLLPTRAVRMVGGRILFDGDDMAGFGASRMRDIRGRRIGTIFQEPMTALNPAFTIGFQIAEPLRRHLKLSRTQAKARVIELLDMVGIHRSAQTAASYPHQLSGGMRQRAMIAMAMSCEPDLLIADEPTTALDVTTQSQILDLVLDLQESHGTAVLLVTHDLGVVAETCRRVVVMRRGEIVEKSDVDALFRAPEHPYTRGLLESMPSRNAGKDRLPTVAERAGLS